MLQELERSMLQLQLLEAMQTYQELEELQKKNEVREDLPKVRQHPDNLETQAWDYPCGGKAGEGIESLHL